jgi:hypothetical protein
MCLICLNVYPEARTGLVVLLRSSGEAYHSVCLTIVPEARTGLGFPFRTTRKAYHRMFGLLD